jgi:hypothetical protein
MTVGELWKVLQSLPLTDDTEVTLTNDHFNEWATALNRAGMVVVVNPETGAQRMVLALDIDSHAEGYEVVQPDPEHDACLTWIEQGGSIG